jgi:hypothetical protein
LQAVGACFWEGLLRLQMPRQSAVLEVRGARARVWLRAEPDVTVTTDHATFLKWLFGIQGAAEFALPREGRAPAVDRLLAALFPREPCASGPWG